MSRHQEQLRSQVMEASRVGRLHLQVKIFLPEQPSMFREGMSNQQIMKDNLPDREAARVISPRR